MTQQTQITLYQGVDVEQAAYMAAFSQPDGLQSVIDQITSQAIEQAQDLDAATAAGRKKLASIAYSVAQAKTAIDGTGKELVADAKAKIKIVDNNRKAVRDQLDNLRDQIRLPVTEFEEAEKAKQAEIQALSDRLFNLSSTVGEYGVRLTAQQLRERLQQVGDLTDGDVPENIKTQAAAVQKSLEESIATAEEYEAQQAEIERLRQEQAAREQAERDARIAAEAAEKAKAEAEAKAKADREAAERARIEAQLRAEQAEREKQQAIERAEAEKKAAVEAERKRQQEERERVAAAEAARAADVEHRRTINRAILAIMLDCGIDEAAAKEFLKRAVGGNVPHLKICY